MEATGVACCGTSGFEDGASAEELQQCWDSVLEAKEDTAPGSSVVAQDEIDALYSVLLERKVIFFRGQQGLTESQHIAFARRFGSTEVFPFSVREGAAPEVMPLKSVGPIAGGASGWHSDVT